MSNELDYYSNLVRIMLKTRGTRFTSSQSLIASDRFSVATLSILSIFLISVSVVSLAAPGALGDTGGKYFSALSVIASVWILVITLFDYALGRSTLAYRLHLNAIRITKIARAMERELAKESPDMALIRRLAAKYEDENAETEVNHSSKDYKIFLFSQQKPNSKFTTIWFPIRNTLFSTLAFCASVPSNLLVLTVVTVATIWYFVH